MQCIYHFNYPEVNLGEFVVQSSEVSFANLKLSSTLASATLAWFTSEISLSINSSGMLTIIIVVPFLMSNLSLYCVQNYAL